MALDKFVLRTLVGGLVLGHGLQKLTGSFGGPGLEGTEKTMNALGLHPAKYQARAVALSETIGGGLTVAGFLSPLGPAMIMGTMAVAIKKVHLKNGLWVSRGGSEFNLTLIGASFALAADGPGLMSVDWVLGKQRSGLKWAMAAAGLGFGAAAAVLRIGEQMTPTAPASDEDKDGAVGEPRSVPSLRHEHDHEGHDHEGHDHEGHDHEGHDHEGHDHSEERQGSERGDSEASRSEGYN
jgi:putative oxidoreductase